MVYEIYFSSAQEAEKAGILQKFSNLITEQYKGGNYIVIDLPKLEGKSPEDSINNLLNDIWDGKDKVTSKYISPRMETYVQFDLEKPIQINLWDTQEKLFKKLDVL
jgi:hypothetical protein